MEYLLSMPLSQTTQFIVFAIPFAYVFYHIRYWYNIEGLRRFDFILGALAVVLSVFMIFKLVQGYAVGREYVQLVLLHLAPLVLTLFLVSIGRDRRHLIGAVAAARGGEKPDQEQKNTFTPVPKSEIEKVGWNDIVVSDDLREELVSIIDLVRDPRTSKRYGISAPKGILLHGPPGTGKTTIAKVMARNAGMSFFNLKSDDIVSKWVGDSEKNLSMLFSAAQRHAPSIIFIDEIDSIGKTRTGTQAWADNLLNHLLQLIDGVQKVEGIYIIAATNRADLVDAALKRPGRLSREVLIPLPDYASRKALFEMYFSRLTLADNVDSEALARIAEGKSGADIQEICNKAGLNAFKRESAAGKRDYTVTAADVERALESTLMG